MKEVELRNKLSTKGKECNPNQISLLSSQILIWEIRIQHDKIVFSYSNTRLRLALKLSHNSLEEVWEFGIEISIDLQEIEDESK